VSSIGEDGFTRNIGRSWVARAEGVAGSESAVVGAVGGAEGVVGKSIGVADRLSNRDLNNAENSFLAFENAFGVFPLKNIANASNFAFKNVV